MRDTSAIQVGVRYSQGKQDSYLKENRKVLSRKGYKKFLHGEAGAGRWSVSGDK